MIKTVSLTANQETEVILAGGCHCCIENRGSGVIYASKASGIIADSDGVTAIDSGNSKVLRNIAQYKKDDDNSYDYYGKIYLLSDSDGKAEIQTANDLNFFSRKNSAKGGGTYDDTAIKADISALQTGKADKSDVYTKSETDSAITSKVAEIVADAPEDFDTLKEMSDWIASHENSASAMNSAIQTNADNISNLQENKANASDLNNYVTKITGKGLSTNDYTTAEKEKLAGLENYDDTGVNNKLYLILSSIGMNKKNLCPVSGGSVTNSGYVIGTSTNYYPIKLKSDNYTISWECNTTTGQSEIKFYDSNKTQIINKGLNNSASVIFDITIPKETSYFTIYTNTSNTISNLMIRYKNITDGTYEPYTDDLQTQINNILARLTAGGI